jgi:hypothetical protein
MLRGACKTIDRQSKKISTVRMPESAKQREIFRLFVKGDLIVPLRRKEACANPRVNELMAADFVPAEVGVDDVPNARYLWKRVFDVLKKQGYLTHAPHPHIAKNGKQKHISAYKLSPHMCVDGVIAELKLNTEEGDWLKKVTACAGRLPPKQNLMDQYLR